VRRGILDFGFWILDFGFWILDFGHHHLTVGYRQRQRQRLGAANGFLSPTVQVLDFGLKSK
jgi:hypothetical protein